MILVYVLFGRLVAGQQGGCADDFRTKRREAMIKTLAVMTSGGDSPGMNAAVRAVVRRALDRGIEVYGIYSGYEGLLRGGDKIKRLDWQEVGEILQRGGTFLGTARSEQFRTLEGR